MKLKEIEEVTMDEIWHQRVVSQKVDIRSAIDLAYWQSLSH